jgi:hypothetical protein
VDRRLSPEESHLPEILVERDQDPALLEGEIQDAVVIDSRRDLALIEVISEPP